MIHKNPLSHYLKKDKSGGAYILDAKSAYVLIPQRYAIHDLLAFEENVRALGVCEIQIEGEPIPYNLYLPSILHMAPSSVSQRNVDDVAYFVLEFKKGDVFLMSDVLLKQDFVISKIFIEFIRNGNLPKFMTYDQMAMMFDVAQQTCGVTLPVPHAIIEMIMAHCCRDADNLNVKYRYSDKKKPPVFLGLRDVTNVRDSTTSKIIGSYLLEGINSGIVNQAEHRSETEDLLRS